MANGASNSEVAKQLRSHSAEPKTLGESDRIDFQLQLVDVRNVKAARTVLAYHGDDVNALKEVELRLFVDVPTVK